MIAFVLCALSLCADTVKQKDGTVLEGEIVAEDEATVSIYLEFSRGTITQTRQINKANIVEIIRWTPQQKIEWREKHDYENLQQFQLSPTTSSMVEYYDQVIDGAFRGFLKQHPDSSYASNVTARIVAWQAERNLVAAGNIKLHSRWSPVAEAARQIGRGRGQQLLQQARLLISQSRFESAIQPLQLVVHMDGQPELVSQAKPLLDSAYQKAVSLVDQQRQKLEGDVSSARQRVELARQALSEAEALQQASGVNSQSMVQAQTAVDNARNDLSFAQNHLGQIKSQLDAVILRLVTLKSQASATTVEVPKSQPAPAPAASTDTLSDIVIWAKKNWVGMAVIALALLFLLSRFLKD